MTAIDWLVVFVYLGGVVALGLWVGRKQEDMDEYFLGGHRIPWWAALLSLVATEISAATFLGAPEQGYTRDLTYLQFAIGSVAARFVLAFLFIGIYYRLRVFTVYGFLTERFGFATRDTAAGMFIVGRLFAGGSRLFIASLAVHVVSGLDYAFSVIVLGAVAILYTYVGGIKAVIWTDVVQAIVLIGGALLSIGLLLHEIPLSAPATWAWLEHHDKLRLFDGGSGLALFSNPYHVIPAVVGGFFLTMATHGTDQSMVQRLLTCKDSLRGKLSLVGSGFLSIAVTILFMVVGLLLFAYAAHLTAGDPMLARANELRASGQNGNYFLYYILHGLPAGASGLIIASLFAAAMSSIDSELSAISSAVVNDFYKPYFAPQAPMRRYMKVARLSTLIAGGFLIAVGVMVARFYQNNPQTDLLSIALGIMTFFYGGLLGVFLVGLLSRTRGSNFTNVSALILSTVLIIAISYKSQLLVVLGVLDPNHPDEGIFATLYHFQLGWPWFVVIGTLVAIAIAAAGKTAKAVVESYGNASTNPAR